jgi:hypothetical protein
MCVTSNCDLEVIQGRQSAVERILHFWLTILMLHYTVGCGATGRSPLSGDRVRPGNDRTVARSSAVYARSGRERIGYIKSTKTLLLPML